MIFMEMFFTSCENKALKRERTIYQSPRFGTSDLDAQPIRRAPSGAGLFVTRPSSSFRIKVTRERNGLVAFQQSNVSIGSGGLAR